MGIGYFAVFVPLFGVSPVHKAQLRDLRLLQANIQQKREGLLKEGRAALTVQTEAPGWADRIRAIGKHVPDGVWLSRIGLEEDRSKTARKPAPGPQSQPEPVKVFLVLEGRVDVRRFASPLEPISRFTDLLRGDPRVREVVPSLQLVSTQVTKEDPGVLAFQVRGLWNPETWKGKVEERIQKQLTAPAPARTGG